MELINREKLILDMMDRGVDHIQTDDLSEINQIIAEQEVVNRWVFCKERLPEEKINPITLDYYEYQCTFCLNGVYDVRSYKFGKGHWWHGAGTMDDCVTAWMPLPEPYNGGEG